MKHFANYSAKSYGQLTTPLQKSKKVKERVGKLRANEKSYHEILIRKYGSQKKAPQSLVEKTRSNPVSAIVQVAKQADYSRANFSPSINASIQNLVKNTLTTKKLPDKASVVGLGKDIAKEFVSNPMQAIKQGFEREKAAKAGYQLATGREVPRKLDLVKGAAKNIAANEDLIVNTGGFIGSKLLPMVAPVVGSGLAGDYLGAAVVRRGYRDINMLKKVANDVRVRNTNNPIGKLQAARKKIVEADKSRKQKYNDYDKGMEDGLGWATGNAGASLLDNVPFLGGIPLKGAAVASLAVPVLKNNARRNPKQSLGSSLRANIESKLTNAGIKYNFSGADMQHFANFGIIKQQNKLKRNTYQLEQGEQLGLGSNLDRVREELNRRYSENRNPMKSNLYNPYKADTVEKKALVKQYNQKNLDRYMNSALASVGGNLNGNRKLKKQWELTGGKVVGNEQLNDYPYPSDLRVNRERRKAFGRPYTEKPPLISNKVRTESDNYSEIRPTEDRAASLSGYVGYQKDRFKGYGGMMEEPVPIEEAVKIIPLKY